MRHGACRGWAVVFRGRAKRADVRGLGLGEGRGDVLARRIRRSAARFRADLRGGAIFNGEGSGLGVGGDLPVAEHHDVAMNEIA